MDVSLENGNPRFVPESAEGRVRAQSAKALLTPLRENQHPDYGSYSSSRPADENDEPRDLAEWKDREAVWKIPLATFSLFASFCNMGALFGAVVLYYAMHHTNKFGYVPFLSQAGMQVPERFVFTGGLCVGSVFFNCTVIGLYLVRSRQIASQWLAWINKISMCIGIFGSLNQVLLAVVTMDLELEAHLIFAGMCFSSCIMHCTLSWVLQYVLYKHETLWDWFWLCWRTFWLVVFIWGATLFVQYDVWVNLKVVFLAAVDIHSHDRMAVGQYCVAFGLAMYAVSYYVELRKCELVFDGRTKVSLGTPGRRLGHEFNVDDYGIERDPFETPLLR